MSRLTSLIAAALSASAGVAIAGTALAVPAPRTPYEEAITIADAATTNAPAVSKASTPVDAQAPTDQCMAIARDINRMAVKAVAEFNGGERVQTYQLHATFGLYSRTLQAEHRMLSGIYAERCGATDVAFRLATLMAQIENAAEDFLVRAMNVRNVCATFGNETKAACDAAKNEERKADETLGKLRNLPVPRVTD